jgi:hypothetical protein
MALGYEFLREREETDRFHVALEKLRDSIRYGEAAELDSVECKSLLKRLEKFLTDDDE